MSKKPCVIGIAGGSASGKTTFTGELEKRLEGLKVHVIHMDSYFKKPEDRPMAPGPITGKVYRDDNHPASMDLPRLESGLTERIAAEEDQVILLEGLMTLWDEALLPLLDLKLFVDCRPEERVVRRLRRNMAWGLTFDQVADVYLDLVRYRHDEFVEPSRWRADLVINGSNPSETALQMLASWVREKVQE